MDALELTDPHHRSLTDHASCVQYALEGLGAGCSLRAIRDYINERVDGRVLISASQPLDPHELARLYFHLTRESGKLPEGSESPAHTHTREEVLTQSHHSGNRFVDVDERADDMEMVESAERKAFDAYDIDGDGKITVADLEFVFAQRGKNVPARELRRWVEVRDLSDAGGVTFRDFKVAYSQRSKE